MQSSSNSKEHKYDSGSITLNCAIKITMNTLPQELIDKIALYAGSFSRALLLKASHLVIKSIRTQNRFCFIEELNQFLHKDNDSNKHLGFDFDEDDDMEVECWELGDCFDSGTISHKNNVQSFVDGITDGFTMYVIETHEHRQKHERHHERSLVSIEDVYWETRQCIKLKLSIKMLAGGFHLKLPNDEAYRIDLYGRHRFSSNSSASIRTPCIYEKL